MLKFKDQNDNVHEVEEGFESLLPPNSIKITEAEASVLQTPSPPTEQEIEDIKTLQADGIVRAFVLDEINTLRANAGLQERTVQQLKNAVKAKL